MRDASRQIVDFANRFKKQEKGAPLEIRTALRDALEIFRDDPQNKALRNHSLNKLGKRYHGLWSIDITEDWRALYRKEEGWIIFIALGTHDKLYKK